MDSHPSTSTSDRLQPSSLSEICLSLVFRQLISILTEIRDSEQNTYAGRQKQLFKLLDFFKKPQSRSDSCPIPSVAPHLVKKLIKLYIEHVSLDTLDYGPNELPLVFYLSICSIYSDLDTFGFKTRESHPDREPCYHQLRLDKPIELELVQKHLQPSQCITILDLTGDRKFTDSGLLHLHHLIGSSVRSIILDHTSVTDLGIAHLSRSLGTAEDSSGQTSELSSPEAFRELRSISCRGLYDITDRSAKKFSRFPNLLSIDLTGTSCTDATRLILNRSQTAHHKQFHFRPAQTEKELESFSRSLEPSEKLKKLLNQDKESIRSDSSFFFQINRSDRAYSKNYGATLESSAFSKRFRPFCLLRSVSAAPSSSSTTPADVRNPSTSNSSNPQVQISKQSSSLPLIKRKKLNPSILDDLLEVKKSFKK
ncbi:hypothetical protein PGT21_010268 [Puccinia graminis f. sp. tritici]|uniref:Uncharacterized protein n=1 Tax=Puccinia graminis f. sp. tritici TaxID=56615 RepID=A0A5B0P232_PUCGR|nr:hypothetical protein PGTUg99_032211 [Puccinia graminis f. sp. tritici]KAA1094119.1 hypothetical protein PGT21_010268 [Puccinia graminis f. sp. tritici]